MPADFKPFDKAEWLRLEKKADELRRLTVQTTVWGGSGHIGGANALAARLAGAAEWHSNADEPDTRGYQERLDDRSPRRSSDHDPLVVGFRLRKP